MAQIVDFDTLTKYLDAVQAMEELGGPTDEVYLATLRAIIQDCRRRIWALQSERHQRAVRTLRG